MPVVPPKDQEEMFKYFVFSDQQLKKCEGRDIADYMYFI